MQVFYTPGASTGKHAILTREESRHCVSVLRLTRSEIVGLIDGKGGFYRAVILQPDPQACEVEIIDYQAEYNRKNCRLHLAIAPTKQIDRFEWFLEKAVEIGINEVTPLRCFRSERKEIKTERLEKIIVSSMKQAIVAYKPALHDVMPYEKFIRSFSGTGVDRFIAHCDGQDNLPLKNALMKDRDTVILIGPEGDFTQEEIRLALDEGFKPVSLGNNRLRTETAALAACVIFNTFNS